ncbi:hypothetical protein FQT05_14725 [Enterococcus hirae]|nr:hypothetical protein [Enterococcus hirae]
MGSFFYSFFHKNHIIKKYICNNLFFRLSYYHIYPFIFLSIIIFILLSFYLLSYLSFFCITVYILHKTYYKRNY